MSFEQILEAGAAKRSTTASPSTDNQLQDAFTRAQEAISSAANEVSQALGLNNLPAPETVANQLHNQTLSFARTLGQFVGQLQSEVSLCDDTVSSSLIYISKFKGKVLQHRRVYNWELLTSEKRTLLDGASELE